MKLEPGNSRLGLGKLLLKIQKTQKFVTRILFLAIFMSASSAYAAGIQNTVTAKGTAPGGIADAIEATADATVDVENAAPDLEVLVSSSDSDVAVGGTMTYTYTIENKGNITLTAVSLADAHDGQGSNLIPAFAATALTDVSPLSDSTDTGTDDTWDSLAPGDKVTWTATYTVVQADLNNNGGGDGDIDSIVTASATPAAGSLSGPFTDSAAVTLQTQNASLSITKTADKTLNVEVGEVITYTYEVTNDGNVPITNIALTDNVNANAGSGPDPIPAIDAASLVNTSGTSVDNGTDEIYDTLGVGDKISYTGTYVVTQSDVDTLQ